MGKIVKYCSECQESFAEKFSFCPNCARELSAFEMKPVGSTEATPVPETPSILELEAEGKTEQPEIEPEGDVLELSETVAFEGASKIEVPSAAESVEEIYAEEPAKEESFVAAETQGIQDLKEHNEIPESDESVEEVHAAEPAKEETFVAAETQGLRDRREQNDVSESADSAEEVPAAGTFLGLLNVESGEKRHSSFDLSPIQAKRLASNYDFERGFGDESYHVTVVSEKSSSIRKGLLITSSLIIVIGFLGLLMYSLFTTLENVASLADDATLISLLDDTPLEIEEQEKKKNDEEGGGGGGGGKEEEKPVSKGELVTQSRTLLTPPSPTIPRLTNPELAVMMGTEGDIKRNRIEPPGLPGALSDDPSSGPGSGGGMGTGRGTGMGSGFGTGEGSGTGSGSGGGTGDGTGDGTGRGSGAGNPPPVRSGPTTALKITYKPRPGYTDAARQNNVTGTVMLRVTFLASGRIGNVSTVKSLPYGLTENAISAARQIQFEPPMRNGQAYPVNKVVHFNFTIY